MVLNPTCRGVFWKGWPGWLWPRGDSLVFTAMLAASGAPAPALGLSSLPSSSSYVTLSSCGSFFSMPRSSGHKLNRSSLS